MKLVLVTLCLLVGSTLTAASGSLEHETGCGKYHVTNSDDPSSQLFYIDGKLVERYLFCKAMHEYRESKCFVHENVRDKYCQSLGTIKLIYIICGFSL